MSEPDNTPRRRPPTIDLTAKEVETGETGSAPGDAATGAKARNTAEQRDRSFHIGSSAIGVAIGMVIAAAVVAGLWIGGFAPWHETSTGPVVPAANHAPNDEISARLDKIQQALQPHSTEDGLAARLTSAEAQDKSLGESLAALARRVDEIAAASQSALSEAKAAAASAGEAKKSADASVKRGDLDALSERIAALESAIKSLGAAQRGASADDSAARATIAAEALRAAAERGGPYQAELAAVQSFGADKEAVAALAPFAVGGIPGAATLARELAALIPALRHAVDAANNDSESWLGRLETRAQRLEQTPQENSHAMVRNYSPRMC